MKAKKRQKKRIKVASPLNQIAIVGRDKVTNTRIVSWSRRSIIYYKEIWSAEKVIDHNN
jgi:hypothetical protein